MGNQPLHGVRVVELATGVAGPYAGKLLADYGADVVKVEPAAGDPARWAGPFPGDVADPEQSALFLHLNTNKRSVVDRGVAGWLDRLVASADIVIESGSPGTQPITAWRAANPRLVVASVTWFGQDGPYAHLAGEEIVTYAIGGPMAATGVIEREPVKLGGNQLQYQCGNVAAVAILAALTVAERRGQGVHIDLANVETQAGSMDRRLVFLLQHAYNGKVVRRDPTDASVLLPTGLYPAADGFVQIGTAPIWVPRMLDALDDDDLRVRFHNPDWVSDPDLPGYIDAALYPWLLSRSKLEATRDAQAVRYALTALRTPLEVLDDEQLEARKFFVDVDHPAAGRYRTPGAPIRFGADGWALRRPAPTLDQHATGTDALPWPARDEPARNEPAPAPTAASGALPLHGVRVLDLTVVWAGPYCTMFLADLGADVVKIDNPWVFPTNTRGAFVRPNREQMERVAWLNAYPDDEPGERPWNRVALFNAHSRGKRSVTVDLRADEGREAFLRLIEQSDILVENNSVGVIDKLGIGWDVLHARNPRLILLRMPAVGLEGPQADYLGFGTHFEAWCGLTAIRGYATDDPADHAATTRPVYHMDPASGAAGAFAAMLALRRRERSGVGELVELAQVENMVNHIGEYLVDAARTGRTHGPLGNRHPTRAPQGCYPCLGEDRWAVLSVGHDEEWAGLVRAMGAPDWAADERFASPAGRRAHHDELDTAIGAWTAEIDRFAVFERCQAEGVPAAPVLDEADCFHDQHLRTRGFFRPNGSVEAGTHDYPGHLWHWDGPDLAWGAISRMGVDNRDIWQGVVGMSDAEYDAFDAAGNIALGYLRPDGTEL